MSGDPQQDTDALATFAHAVRPDWHTWAVRTAVGEALHNGWTWKQAVAEVVRLLWIPDALPGDLVPPQRGTSKTPASHENRRAVIAAVKADLESRRPAPKGGAT